MENGWTDVCFPAGRAGLTGTRLSSLHCSAGRQEEGEARLSCDLRLDLPREDWARPRGSKAASLRVADGS